MKCSQVSLLAHNLVTPCLGREPKVRVATTMKVQLLKLQTKNKHLVAKGVEVEKAIKKAKALQQEYNELNRVHFKSPY